MTPEGSVILGSRHTTVYIVNAATGSLIHAFSEVDGRPVTFGGRAGAFPQLQAWSRCQPSAVWPGLTGSVPGCDAGKIESCNVRSGLPDACSRLHVQNASRQSPGELGSWLM